MDIRSKRNSPVNRRHLHAHCPHRLAPPSPSLCLQLLKGSDCAGSFEARSMSVTRFSLKFVRALLPPAPLFNAAARHGHGLQASPQLPITLVPAPSRLFSTDSGSSKPMSFIEKAKLLGANAILGAMTHQGGFDSALQGMNIDRIDNGSCAASLVVTPNLANA
jgi:hypothetical protein